MTWSACTGSEMMNEAFITAFVWEKARLERGHFESMSRDG